ncbi:MFS transporter [Schaalia sp. 19OD2882]|uniref:glycoside-pentoside-hexuronide (GPH):cation symporter n=1 Tax=Schaalia sp. 19OD2882 TaxID=2794089 RepID=UPI001C1E8FF7|nr:glycoside-pentoside-hexuronide (GPH):cation symporter [Schaalia sp. 19OD2882]QWW20226.1 MFS transporter [Schaalia sp. 19OD2882]
MDPNPWRNRLSFGLGTVGRDMTAALVGGYLIFYLTEVAHIGTAATGAVTVVLVVMRIFDAANDPIMGMIIDNTRTRWGKFKPWLALGAVLWCAATFAFFMAPDLRGWAFIAWFTVVYLVWSIAYTINDISFWSMLPALSQDQRERERIGSVARICANAGLFVVVVSVVPATKALGQLVGSATGGWLAYAGILVAANLGFQMLTLAFTRERVEPERRRTSLREVLGVLVRNDQLMWVTASMLAYMSGYMTVTSLGIYWFKYVYRDEDAYSVFAVILAVAQLGALALFPALRARLRRSELLNLGMVSSAVGLGVFWFAGSSLALVAVAGVLLFAGQGIIQLLMLMFVTDCVEYGQWRFGRRNESITLAVQPFIYKASTGISSGFIGVALLVSGISAAHSVPDVTPAGVHAFKLVMLVVPIFLTALAWAVLRRGYRLDEARFAAIMQDLRQGKHEAASDAGVTSHEG